MANRSKLQRFAIQHPTADLAIVFVQFHDWINTKLMYSETEVNIIWQNRVIATYSRRRDAWRALRSCGYRQEGSFWRLAPASVRPVPPIAIEVTDLMGDL